MSKSSVPGNDLVCEHFNKAERTISCTEGKERGIKDKKYQMPCERRPDCNEPFKDKRQEQPKEEVRKEIRKIIAIAKTISNLPSR